MQLNRNSSHKPGTNLSDLLTYYYMVFKMALFLVLEKKSIFFLFLVVKLKLYENDLQEMIRIVRGRPT